MLEELGIPYEHRFVPLANMEKEPFESLKPTRRASAIEDPNTNIVLFDVSCVPF